ncbi:MULTISPECIES: NAD(P)/FAD-dependent oxidoreductase [unclassified Leifsonia]|uniref:NAD(P)/FAD-dependent oxidoreductase n=1 Tax=unclassified Leifsonia TaxID=2663824 RepID=UPI00038248BC|nr:MULTISPECIES: FAD-dependent oxidoreductase [unclassified Leifsonia]TDQ02311.1 glycine/D-amino acid oxidase-like deaminating enzyme [Leifsonia sp. 115AMFTsu3.1]
MSAPIPAYDLDLRSDPAVIDRALRGAKNVSFWLDDPRRPAARSALSGDVSADLLVVGGGYCGLWTALLAKERKPDLEVVLVEGKEVGWAASGRNGGFVEASLTHGSENGERYFPAELETLDRLGMENWVEFAADLKRHGIEAEYEATGVLTVATEPHQVSALREAAGEHSEFLDEGALRRYVTSPLFRAGLFERDGEALVHPALLAWGLKQACLSLGVKIYEHTPVRGLSDERDRVRATTSGGVVSARRVVLATNGFPSLLRRNRFRTIPVYDYALMTEPLSEEQLEAIGWTERFGMTDSSRQFHYYRKSADNRILWGGYDAVYHPGGRIKPSYDVRDETFRRLADHFLRTFPQLGDITFTHAWGGMIDMSSRLVAFHGTAMGDKVAYSSGFTGLGVAATRFAAKVMLELLDGADTEITRTRLVRTKPLPIPPEPVASAAVAVIKRAIVRSDRNGGRDGVILKVADALGYSFDS